MTQVPNDAAKFLKDYFPDGTLCRFVNRRTGTLLDVRPNLDVVNDEIPQVVCNQESAGVQYWIITPFGDGQAIVPVPKDGSSKIRYLTPSSVSDNLAVTISPFPVSWIIFPTTACPKFSGSPLVVPTVPLGQYAEWTCQICWPHFKNTEPKVLDLLNPNLDPNSKVTIYTHGAGANLDRQFWRVQFIRGPAA
ncbi:hypothetical protein C8F04DRAFT_1084370 [Mycena alexandri]|uniref:Uncharacterized protein n=1 Tax=Mycena alexandri TaxID=1745969 RepID=A0AAD6T8Y1_9AGAR|nr:hypothetical protein C8F04DRAFT_1084370 [Mycena alexandri]